MANARAEKRKSPRAEVHGEAIAIIPDGRKGCVVKDLSATGAKLNIPRRSTLPAQFQLLLLKAKTTRRVTVRWRRGDFTGVEFV